MQQLTDENAKAIREIVETKIMPALAEAGNLVGKPVEPLQAECAALAQVVAFLLHKGALGSYIQAAIGSGFMSYSFVGHAIGIVDPQLSHVYDSVADNAIAMSGILRSAEIQLGKGSGKSHEQDKD